ncbi:hypothetical protein DFH06DRAFT_1296747 [Mycena polygramma]|nr:hypothetical protein DFH06DRAFT_1296747 [Mycena polygramma]
MSLRLCAHSVEMHPGPARPQCEVDFTRSARHLTTRRVSAHSAKTRLDSARASLERSTLREERAWVFCCALSTAGLRSANIRLGASRVVQSRRRERACVVVSAGSTLRRRPRRVVRASERWFPSQLRSAGALYAGARASRVIMRGIARSSSTPRTDGLEKRKKKKERKHRDLRWAAAACRSAAVRIGALVRGWAAAGLSAGSFSLRVR